MNCCQLLRALQISDDKKKFNGRMKSNGIQMSGSPNVNNQTEPNQIEEIQCKDISQSQMSPVVQSQSVQKSPQMQQIPPPQQHQSQQPQPQPQQPQPQLDQMTNNMYGATMPMQMSNATPPNSGAPAANFTVQSQQTSMRPDIYQRTLEYVQNCQSWTEQPEMVTSTSNMQISDMSTSLSSLLEENRYYNSVL